MKTEQEKIEEIADIKSVLIKTHKRCRSLQEDYMQDNYAEGIYKAGYRKASDVIDEFVERLEKYIESRNDLWDEDRPEFDEEFVNFGIQIVADEMRQEVEK